MTNFNLEDGIVTGVQKIVQTKKKEHLVLNNQSLSIEREQQKKLKKNQTKNQQKNLKNQMTITKQTQNRKQSNDFDSASKLSCKQTECEISTQNDTEDNRFSEKKQLFQNSEKSFIGTIDQAPKFMIDNANLLRGYRINFNDYKKIFKSLFMWHNDTLNIWTHLVGASLAVYLFVLEILKENPQNLGKFPIYSFLLGSIVMFLSSATMHLIYCKDAKTCQCSLKLDYSGIAICGIGKGLSFMSYGLYCESKLNLAYTVYWLTTWSILLVLSQFDFFHQQKYKKIKIFSFMMVSLGFFIPTSQILYLHFTNALNGYNPMGPFYLVILYFSVLGVGILIGFVFEFPERQFPGKFEFIGSSHQIWHMCVILDYIINYYSAMENFELRSQNMDCGLE